MNNLFTYLIETSLISFVFYLFWQLVLADGNNFRFNRFYLLGALFLSFLLPHINISLGVKNLEQAYVIKDFLLPEIKTGNETQENFNWYNLLIYIYLSGIFVFSGKLLFGLFSLAFTALKAEIRQKKTHKLVLVNRQIAVSSFGNYIFCNKDDYETDSIKMIITHELAHIKQRHSVDILIAELAVILLWFNPLMYHYKKILQETHEYLADEEVLKQNFQLADYQMLLLKQQLGFTLSLTSMFKQSLTLKRLEMMNKTKIKTGMMFKAAGSILLVVALFFVFSCSKTSDEIPNTDELQKIEKQESEMIKKTEGADENGVYLKPEQMAEFPGGMSELRKFLAQNLKYPEEARNGDISGKVYVRFVIDTDGAVGDVSVLRAVHELLDQEAVRVIKLLPNFEPAMQDGKAVKMYYTLPINFSIQ